MTDKELLVAARKLIERPEDWANFNPAGRADCSPTALFYLQVITSWNDSHTHAEVLAAFDRAIAARED